MKNEDFTILCVDDERSILNALKRLLRKEACNLLFAGSGKEGLAILEKHEVHLVVSDQRMPEMSGTEFLSIVKRDYPSSIRVILTGYSDIDSITNSINEGNIYKFFFKPWDDLRLKSEIRQIRDQYVLKHANQQLDQTVEAQKDKLQTMNQNMETMNQNMDRMVEIRTRELELQNHMLELSHAILDDLPISVIGIDIEGIIVMANKRALDVLRDHGVEVGRAFSDVFPEGAAKNVRKVFETGREIRINGSDLDFENSEATLQPLSGNFKGKGVIMTMMV